VSTAGDLFCFPCAIVSRPSTFLQEPFECYHIADIESGLGLKRKQMVSMALLIGSDHDLHGVPGFGLETALRFVQLFAEDEILDKYVSYFLVFSFQQNNLPQCCIHGASHLIYTSPGYMKLVEGCIPSLKDLTMRILMISHHRPRKAQL